MGSPTRDIRNEEAKKLLDYGFANYAVYTEEESNLTELTVKGGTTDACRVKSLKFSTLIDKGAKSRIRKEVHLPEYLAAPIKTGEKVGTVAYYVDDRLIGETDIVTCEDIMKISFGEIFVRLFKSCLGIKL